VSPRLSDALLRVQSDERLVALARSGHERAFVAIVERYRRPLHAFARRLVGEPRVEDVLQQSFVNAWAALSAGADVRHLRGWLHQIVRNAAITAARTPGEEALSETMIGSDGPQDQVELQLMVRETLHQVARLPDQQRSALVQTAMEGRSREEIASALGLSEGAVRGLVHRARTTLRAAATALTPLPVAVWAAGGGAGATPGRGAMPLAERVGELVAGAGSASLAGAAVKAAGVVVATGAIATSVATDLPPIRHHNARRDDPRALAERAPVATPMPPAAHVARAPTVTEEAVAVARPVAEAVPKLAHTTPVLASPTEERRLAQPRIHTAPRRSEAPTLSRDGGDHSQQTASGGGDMGATATQASGDGNDGGHSGSDGGSGSSDGGSTTTPTTTTTTTSTSDGGDGGGSSTDGGH